MVHHRKPSPTPSPEVPLLGRTNTRELAKLHQSWLDKPEDLTVQQRTDSNEWHRPAVGGAYTACGERINHRLSGGARIESYEGELCQRGCFSPFELALSVKVNKEAAERRAREEAERDAKFYGGTGVGQPRIPGQYKEPRDYRGVTPGRAPAGSWDPTQFPLLDKGSDEPDPEPEK